MKYQNEILSVLSLMALTVVLGGGSCASDMAASDADQHVANVKAGTETAKDAMTAVKADAASVATMLANDTDPSQTAEDAKSAAELAADEAYLYGVEASQDTGSAKVKDQMNVTLADFAAHSFAAQAAAAANNGGNLLSPGFAAAAAASATAAGIIYTTVTAGGVPNTPVNINNHV